MRLVFGVKVQGSGFGFFFTVRGSFRLAEGAGGEVGKWAIGRVEGEEYMSGGKMAAKSFQMNGLTPASTPASQRWGRRLDTGLV